MTISKNLILLYFLIHFSVIQPMHSTPMLKHDIVKKTLHNKKKKECCTRKCIEKWGAISAILLGYSIIGALWVTAYYMKHNETD